MIATCDKDYVSTVNRPCNVLRIYCAKLSPTQKKNYCYERCHNKESGGEKRKNNRKKVLCFYILLKFITWNIERGCSVCFGLLKLD